MRRIWNIYKNDIRNIVTNYAAFITIAALCVLPSLYAWFNIAASWNPYAQEATSQIKIGVVNNDKGTELNGEEINMGDSIVDQLKENDLMGWQFVGADEAERMLQDEKFYANIIIPEDFSKQITSLITSNIEKGDIVYRVNEKINAIAPKLTDKGASGIQENISKTLVETVSSTLLNVTKDIGIEIENAKPKIANVYNLLKEIQGKFSDIDSTVDLAYGGAVQLKDLTQKINDDIPSIQNTIDSAKTLGSDLQDFLNTSKGSLNDISPSIKNDIGLIGDICNEISDYTSAIIEAVNSGSDKAPEMIDTLEGKLSSLNDLTSSLINILQKFNKLNPSLNSVIDQLNNVNSSINTMQGYLSSIKDVVNSGAKPDLSLLNNIKSVADSVSSIASGIYSSYDNDIAGKINGILDSAYTASSDAINVLDEAGKKLPDVSSLLNTAYEGADKGISGLEFIKEKLPEAEEMINSLVEKMDAVNNDEGLGELLDLITKDVQERSDFLTNPVNLIEEDIFTMGNYGSAMAPFYTTLALWAGALFLVSILSVNPHEEHEPNGEFLNTDNNHESGADRRLSTKEYVSNITTDYFGKLLLFVTLGILQSIITALGDLYLLKIYCLNPLLFTLATILTGITFAFIIYTMCSVLGNVGKVVCIVLLVFQIGGSSGTFPVELTPKFFQRIHPFLPFTYTVSLMRETIGGIVKDVVVNNLSVIGIFIALSLIIGIFLKVPFNRFVRKFNEKFEESHIGE